jgi:hypothetical protein
MQHTEKKDQERGKESAVIADGEMGVGAKYGDSSKKRGLLFQYLPFTLPVFLLSTYIQITHRETNT